MTQSSYPLDAQNFPSPHNGVLAVSLICTTALEGLEANTLDDVKLAFAKDLATKFLRLLRLACQVFQSDRGFVTMK